MPSCNWPSCSSNAATWRCSRARTPRTRRRRKPRSPTPGPPTRRPTKPMASRSKPSPPPTRRSRSPCPRATLGAPSATRSYATYLNAMLQKGVADYELAHTFPADSADRTKYLKAALDQFESLYKSYREQFAGLAAQMWQAKCFEEQGDIGAAIGLYKQLLGHGDPRLRDLQRNVGYFYIVALAKRKQYALAGRRGDAMAGEVQPARRMAVEGRAGRDAGAGQGHRCPDARDRRRRPSQGRASRSSIP